MRKQRHKLTAAEEAALAADILLRESLVTKALMRKYNASRSLVDRVSRETKQNAFNLMPAENEHRDTLADNSHMQE